METKSFLVRPANLVEGAEYLVGERNGEVSERSLVPVRFVAYCASPAFVIVRNGKGKMRCAREEIFLYTQDSEPNLPIPDQLGNACS